MPSKTNVSHSDPVNGSLSSHRELSESSTNSLRHHEIKPTIPSVSSDSSKRLELSQPYTEDWSLDTKDLLDALPQVWIRGLLYLLIIFSITIIPWSMFSKVDETGQARGQIEPKSKTVRLDAPVSGKVTEIMVEEGDVVTAGQTLLKLDSEETRSELEQVSMKKLGNMDRLVQLESLRKQLVLALRTQKQQNNIKELEKLAQVKQAEQTLGAAKSLEDLQRPELLAQITQLQQAIKSAESALNLEDIRTKASQEKVPRYLKAFNKGVVSKDRFDETEQQAMESLVSLQKAQADLAQRKSQLKEKESMYQRLNHQANSEIQQTQLRLEEHQRNYQSLIHSGKLAILKNEEQINNLETEIASLKSETAQLDRQIKSLEFQLKRRLIHAPTNGIVFQRHVQSAGAVLQPGEKMLEISQDTSMLVLRAYMATTESESLRVGMPVKIKFDAYSFQNYGVVDGQVSWISPDTKTQETQQGDIETFELEIKLNQTYIESSTKRFNLTPGQTAAAEVIIRQRRVIDFILDPFKKLQKSGLEL